jgi:hypothetical protein
LSGILCLPRKPLNSPKANFEEIVEGIKALAESYSICMHNQDWTTVCRKPRQFMPGDAGHQKQEPIMEEGEPEEHEEILSGFTKFWYQ